jgi:hypothetical protein
MASMASLFNYSRLCIQVPHAGGRVFERGDEEFLNFATNGNHLTPSHRNLSGLTSCAVPVIVVFTQFDKLIKAMENNLTDEEWDKPDVELDCILYQRADEEFKKICLGPLRRIDRRLRYARTSGSLNFTKPTFLDIPVPRTRGTFT